MIDPVLSADAPAHVTERSLRQFAAVWLVVFGALAARFWLVRSQPTTAVVILAVAVAVGISGLIRPAAIRPVFDGAMAVTRPIGWVISHIILATLFYGLFTPVAIAFRLAGRDALQRRRPRDTNTYWRRRPGVSDLRDYFRQS